MAAIVQYEIGTASYSPSDLLSRTEAAYLSYIPAALKVLSSCHDMGLAEGGPRLSRARRPRPVEEKVK